MMKLTVKILRQRSRQDEPYWESVPYETADDRESVASMLRRVNEGRDDPVRWDCSCLQKKCGACAMLIGGRPALACDTPLKKAARRGVVELRPLSKFPVVADLIVDRQTLFENLKQMQREAAPEGEALGAEILPVYDASRCLACGCCLEVCPNYGGQGDFFGAAAFVPAARLLSTLNPAERERLRREYAIHAYEGCGKSLACQDICPAGIDIERLLLKTNALMFKRKK